MNAAWRDRYEAAMEAAHRAGRHAMRYFDAGVNVEWKKNETPVTVADREAEAILKEDLLEEFPEDGFLGEESGETPGTSGFRWIVDPIDGTRSFVRGIPIWATIVGLEYKDEQISGICFIPPMNQMYRALRGDGAYRDDRPLKVSTVDKLEEAQVFYSGINWFIKGPCRDSFLELVSRTQRQRGFGDFYGFMLVAQGSGELMVDYGVSAWDVAGIKPIVEEAGGVFTDWDNKPTIHRPDVLVSNGKLHQVALDLLRSHATAGFRPEVVENVKEIT